MSLTREEILGLSKLTELEQYCVLLQNGIISEGIAGVGKESLADCAERLWREAVKSQKIVDAMTEIEQVIGEECYIDAEAGEHTSWYWWAFLALSSHRIQAALLAGEGK